MITQKKSPTVLNNYNEENTSKYILFVILGVLDNKTSKRSIYKSMNLVQEELFVYSRTEETNDILVGQNLANTQDNAKTSYYFEALCIIINTELCCIWRRDALTIRVGEGVISEPPEIKRDLIFLEKPLNGENIWI